MNPSDIVRLEEKDLIQLGPTKETIKCPRCDQNNYTDVRFCERCEIPLGGSRIVPRPDLPMANLTTRIIAKIIDLPFTAASIILAGQVPNSINWSEVIQLSLILVGAFGMITQVILLSTYGQTIGKKLMKLKIVSVSTNRNGGFITNVMMRAIVNGLLSFTVVYFVIDCAFMFFSNRLCLHDYIAGTKVVEITQTR